MDDMYTLYVFVSALLISTVAWLLNPFGKLCSVLSHLFKSPQTGHHARSFEEMPGPKGLPYFGDVINYLKTSEFKDQMATLKSNFEKYGPVFKRTIMGRTIVCIKDPKDVEIVFKADGRYPMRPTQAIKANEAYRKSRDLPPSIVSL